MGKFLRTHALAHLWCEPIQDRQYYISPARLTQAGGAFREAKVLWETVPLPSVGSGTGRDFYHLYQVGQLDPSVFNIQMSYQSWISAATLAMTQNVDINVYLPNGARVPKTDIWLYRHYDKNLLIAVRHFSGIDLGVETYTDISTGLVTERHVSLNTSPIVVHFYSNARYDSVEWRNQAVDPLSGMRCLTKFIATMADYIDWLAACNAVETFFGSQGRAIYQRDGFVVSKPTSWNSLYVGTTYSMVWDATMTDVSFYPLLTTPTFISTLDPGVVKYTIVRHQAYDMIDYHDDVDFFLVAKSSSTVYRGVAINQQAVSTVRQLTHNAYAVSKSVIDALIAAHTWLASADVLEIMVAVRQGGMRRGLVHQHNRIEELYKLTYAEIVTAMGVSNTSVPEWRAAVLEASAYTAVMRSSDDGVTDALVEQAYGYNTATQVAAAPLQPTTAVDDTWFVTVPDVLTVKDVETNQGLRALFAYQDGVLLGYSADHAIHESIPLPVGMSPADSVECFNYAISTTIDGIYYDVELETHDLAQYGFRVYACPIIAGVPSEHWEDITDLPYYTYDPVGTSDNDYTPTLRYDSYLLDFAHLYPCVKINKVMHVFTPDVATDYRGFIKFQVATTVHWLGSDVVRPQSIPPGHVDVFLEGRSLIEDIDYYVAWPEIVIVKRQSNTLTTDSVMVRTYGFCRPDGLQHAKPREVGFVRGGILSVNGHYDIRNDRPIRTIVAGQLRRRDTVRYAELGTGPLTTDGRPYAVTDYVVPVENFTGQRLVPYHSAAINLDQRVMDYLTPRLPNLTVRHPMIMTERWDVVSPFASALIDAILSGELDSVPFASPYDATDVAGWVAPWIDLLPYDPCVRGFDTAYIVVYPHPYFTLVELTIEQYMFMEFVIRHYLNNRTDQTPSVAIG